MDEDGRQLKARETRIGELQDWCTHLQSIVDEEARQREEREQQYRRLEQRYGVFFRLTRRFIQHL